MTQTTPSTSAQGPVRPKPLDLSNMLRDAFLAGRGLKDGDKLSEADQAAWVAYDPERMTAYKRICAYLAASPPPAASPASPGGVRVKPLTWHRVTYGWLAFEEWYRIEDNGPNWTDDRFWLYERGDRLGKFGTLEDAQAAMQVRHDQRISASLASDATPPPASGSEEAGNV